MLQGIEVRAAVESLAEKGFILYKRAQFSIPLSLSLSLSLSLDRQTETPSRETGRQPDRQTDRQTVESEPTAGWVRFIVGILLRGDLRRSAGRALQSRSTQSSKGFRSRGHLERFVQGSGLWLKDH